MNDADQLDACADYIEEHGWTRGSYEYKGRVCAIGAMKKITGDDWISYRAIGRAMDRYICLQENVPVEMGVYIDQWNDDQKSRKSVIKAFRGAAAALREEG
jgi:hypothetical protein